MHDVVSRTHRFALIVEDDPDQRELVSALLEETGLEIVTCESAECALSLMECCGPKVDTVFTDVRLPGLRDGLELSRIITLRWPAVNVIVTSGYPLAAPVPKGVTYLPKPWRALEVLAHVA